MKSNKTKIVPRKLPRRLAVYVYMYFYVHVCLYVRIKLGRMYACFHVCMYVYMHACMQFTSCICACMNIRMNICTYRRHTLMDVLSPWHLASDIYIHSYVHTCIRKYIFCVLCKCPPPPLSLYLCVCILPFPPNADSQIWLPRLFRDDGAVGNFINRL